MRAVLKLELIGENYHDWKRDKVGKSPRTERYGKYLGWNQSASWVARITGLDDKFGFKRQFMRGQRDYTEANSTGSRGIFTYYALPDGIYEVNNRYRWRKVRRYGWRYEEIPSNRNIKARRYLLVDVEQTEAIRAERNLHDLVK